MTNDIATLRAHAEAYIARMDGLLVGTTPGPWEAKDNVYGVHFVHGGPEHTASTGTKYRGLVCGGNSHDTLKEDDANLIAAAPGTAHDTRALITRLLAALDEARNGALEDAAKACEAQQQVFLSDGYSTGQPLASFGERFACGECAKEIRALATKDEGIHADAARKN